MRIAVLRSQPQSGFLCYSPLFNLGKSDFTGYKMAGSEFDYESHNREYWNERAPVV